MMYDTTYIVCYYVASDNNTQRSRAQYSLTPFVTREQAIDFVIDLLNYYCDRRNAVTWRIIPFTFVCPD